MADARSGRRPATGRGALSRGRAQLMVVAGAAVGAALAILAMIWF
ncbi:hypothetical protein [Micropruina sp.]|nr:hypothetical protein [Micropruina sp.]